MIGAIFGLIGIITWTLSVQFEKKKDILTLQNISNFCYMLQYIAVGAYSAASMNMISGIRGMIYRRNEVNHEKNSKSLLFILIILILVLGIISYDNLLSIYPTFTTLLYTIATWYKRTKWLRAMFTVLSVGSIYYNLVFGAYILILGSVFDLISGIIGFARHENKEIKNKKEIKNDR